MLFDRDGCLKCDTVPVCLQCGSDEQCAMTTQTCDKCPTTYCIKNSQLNNGGSNANLGLSGGQVAAIAATLAVVGALVLAAWAFVVWRRRKTQKLNIFSAAYNSSSDGNRLYKVGMDEDDDEEMEMHSLADSQGVFNVAYIPGVTAQGPPKIRGNDSGSRPSSQAISAFSKDTLFSGLENASIHGGRVATRSAPPAIVQHDSYDFDEQRPEHSDDSRHQQQSQQHPQKQRLFNMAKPSVIVEEEEDDHTEHPLLQQQQPQQPQTPHRSHRTPTRYGILKSRLDSGSEMSENSSDESDSDSDLEDIEAILDSKGNTLTTQKSDKTLK